MSGSQSLVNRLAAPAIPGNLLEMQILTPCLPIELKTKSGFQQSLLNPPGDSGVLKFENHMFTVTETLHEVALFLSTYKWPTSLGPSDGAEGHYPV